MLSGHAEREAVEQGEALGAVDYIRKPCEFSTLLKAIKNADEHRPDRAGRGLEGRRLTKGKHGA